ncbi:MAG: hypothetical protein AB8A37_01135 [Prochlorococcus sp.]
MQLFPDPTEASNREIKIDALKAQSDQCKSARNGLADSLFDGAEQSNPMNREGLGISAQLIELEKMRASTPTPNNQANTVQTKTCYNFSVIPEASG